MRYSTEPGDWIFVKGYRFLSFAGNMSKITGKKISKNLSSKYSQKHLDHAKQSATDALKTIQHKSNSKNRRNNCNETKKEENQQKYQKVYLYISMYLYIYIYTCNYGISKIINFLDKTPNQPFKFTTKNWVEINDNALGMYNTNKEIKFKTTMLKSSLSDYCEENYYWRRKSRSCSSKKNCKIKDEKK